MDNEASWRQSQLEESINLLLDHPPSREEIDALADSIEWLGLIYADAETRANITPRRAVLINRIKDLRRSAQETLINLARCEEQWSNGVDNLITSDLKQSTELGFLDAMSDFSFENSGNERLSFYLQSLIRTCNVRLKILGKDKGGPTNVWKQRHGDAARSLVFAALLLLREHRGDSALKKSESGLAVRFCRAVFSAIGKDPETIDLPKRVKSVIGEILANP